MSEPKWTKGPIKVKRVGDYAGLDRMKTAFYQGLRQAGILIGIFLGVFCAYEGAYARVVKPSEWLAESPARENTIPNHEVPDWAIKGGIVLEIFAFFYCCAWIIALAKKP